MTDDRAVPQEVEFKLALEPDERDRLVASLGIEPGPPIAQENHFFDTDARSFGASRRALRLREAAGRWTLTAKGPAAASADGVLTTRAEEEAAIEAATAQAVLDGDVDPLTALRAALGRPSPLLEAMTRDRDGRSLRRLGSFRNERCVLGPLRLPFDGHESSPELTLEVDASTFPGAAAAAHELEVEIDAELAQPAEAALRAWFAALDVPWRPAPSKAARFFAALGEGGA